MTSANFNESASRTKASAVSPIITRYIGSHYEVEGSTFHIVYEYDPSNASFTLYKAEPSKSNDMDLLESISGDKPVKEILQHLSTNESRYGRLEKDGRAVTMLQIAIEMRQTHEEEKAVVSQGEDEGKGKEWTSILPFHTRNPGM